MDNWKQIWSKKQLSSTEHRSLYDLIVADGFDTGVGSYDEDSWRKMVVDFLNRTKLNEAANVLELGCGSGAFIFALNELVQARYYGLDYSSSLIETARLALPEADFIASEASAPVFDDISFDIVFSHSVFQYFPNLDYANTVIERWCKNIKQGGMLVLLDLNDKNNEDNYHRERMQAYTSPDDYYDNYKGLEHLFFDKGNLVSKLKACGMTSIEYFDHAVTDYGNAKFRFNIICVKA